MSAATAQDAVNAAVGENVKGLKNSDTPEVGAKMVTYPSGLGFVATGIATYRTVENPTLTRIAKRKAYVIAFTKAKKNLAEILGGLDNEGKETVREALVNINLPKEEMTNISTESQESLKQAVEMMLRGFVIYEVKDDTSQNTVFVSIVTTPKTRGQLARPAPNAIEADSLRDGLNQVIAEVRSGLVPPVGGRIIMMRSTGETAFVGFGSAVVRTSANQAVQAKLNLDAQKIAGMRSKDCALRANHRRQGVVGGERQGIVEGSSPRVRGCQRRTIRWPRSRPPTSRSSPRPGRPSFPGWRATTFTRVREEASCRRASIARHGLTKTTPGPMGCRSTPPAFPTLPQSPGEKCRRARFFSRWNWRRQAIGPTVWRLHRREGNRSETTRQGGQAGADRQDRAGRE